MATETEFKYDSPANFLANPYSKYNIKYNPKNVPKNVPMDNFLLLDKNTIASRKNSKNEPIANITFTKQNNTEISSFTGHEIDIIYVTEKKNWVVPIPDSISCSLDMLFDADEIDIPPCI